MKKPIILVFAFAAIMFAAIETIAQVQIDKPIQLTGSAGQRAITNLELPVNGTDAVNKDYVDAAVAAAGGGSITEITDESGSSMNLGDALRYCQTLNLGGNTDWYLPSHNELLHTVSNGAISIPNASSSNYVWFIDPIPASAQVDHSIRLDNGAYFYHDHNLTSSNYVRCVR